MRHQNQAIRKPTSFTRRSDTWLALVVMTVCLGLTLPVANPFHYGSLLNQPFFATIPLVLVPLVLALPLVILWAISVNQQIKFNEFLKEQHRRERIRLTGRVLFRAQVKGVPDGSSWDIVNTNQFDWTDAHALIERVCDGKKACEKHYLGQVNQRQKIQIDSKLSAIPSCKWRILILTKEGCTTEYPDHWKRPPHEQIAPAKTEAAANATPESKASRRAIKEAA